MEKAKKKAKAKDYSLAQIEQDLRNLIKVADNYPRQSDDIPDERHWRDLPGGFRVCFTKNYVDEKWRYHMSISNRKRRVQDLEAIAVLNIFGVQGDVYEIPPSFNANVRHFLWDCDKELVH